MKKRWLVGLLVSVSLVGCSNAPQEEPFTSSDVKVGFDKITNLEAFEQFATHVENGTKDRIRILANTDEGDPIVRELDFDGKQIHYTYDDSKDKFGGPNKGRKSAVCGKIEQQKMQEKTEYALSDCTPEKSADISYFLMRVPSN